MFINRTIGGLEKRNGLEEAKALPVLDYMRPESHPTELEVPSFHGVSYNRRARDNRLLTRPSSSAVFDQQIVSSFWEKYIPSCTNAQDGSHNHWLQLLIGLPEPGNAICYSLKALAMTRLGWINGDESLALQGRLYYSRGLQVLQKSLSSEKITYEDNTFAAVYALSIYEARSPLHTSFTGSLLTNR